MKIPLFIYIVFVFSIVTADAAPVLAQPSTTTTDKGGDTERVPSEISLNIKAGKYEIIESEYMLFKQKQSGSIIRMEGFNATTSSGDPVLPIRIYEIALPPNVDWQTMNLSVETGETKMLPGEFDILPAPPMLAYVDKERLVDWGHGKDIVAGYNMNTYGKDKYFPLEPARLVSHSQLRKWRFVQVSFSPIQYNPAKKSVRLVQSVKLTLSFMRIGKSSFRSDPLLVDTIMDEEAKKRFINFKEAQEWYRYVPELRSDASVADLDYAIVTTNAIRDNSTKLADFVAHKTALGHGVQIVTEDDYGMTGSAEAIREWLVENYAALGIHYVLLIGDPDPDDPDSASDSVGDVPMVMGWPYRFFYKNRESPTDYFFADLTGDWDLDGDGRYGESERIDSPTSPDGAVDPDTFSVRWTGKIQVDVDGAHSFTTVSDEGIRLMIDGTTVIDNWTDHPATTDYGSIVLTAGQHDILVEYYDDTGDGVAKLLWRPPGQVYTWPVPSTKLYHLVAGSYVSGGLDAEYFNNIDFTDPALTRVDNRIDFVWATGDKGEDGVDFSPEVFVGRIPVYDDDYTMLDTILQKIIDYETGAPPDWRRSFLTAHVEKESGEPDISNYQLGEALKADVADPLGFSTYRIYESDFGIIPMPECTAINPKDPDPAATCNMLSEWANSDGYGLVTWTTHGGSTHASQLIESEDAINLNDATPAFTFQSSCWNGEPETSDNLGYALLQQGAIGTVSASRVSWYEIFNPAWDPNPLSGNNENLAYYYTSRMMQDRTAGHALYITKSNVVSDNHWMNKMDYNLYGDPSVSLFNRISGLALLFDTSGSMALSHEGNPGVVAAEQRLSLAKEASYPFLELLNDHANTRVNFGITAFPTHPWDYSEGCSGQVIMAKTLVDETSKNEAITTVIPGLTAEGNTPLFAGLDMALGTFDTEAPRAIVLLSDGYHNCPEISGVDDPAVDTMIDNLNAASTRVYTIGFGRPSDIDHPLLNRLAVDTGGEFYDVTSATFDPEGWSPATDLQSTYKAILVNALGLETAADPIGVIGAGTTVTHEVKINEYDKKVSFFLSWQTPQENRLTLRVKTSDGRNIPVTQATPGMSFHQGKTYKIITMNREFLQIAGKVGPDPWVLEIGTGVMDQDEDEHYHYSVIVDSGLKMDVAFDKEKYWVGDAITLQAKLTADRQPVTGLEGVRVKISKPEDGLGNWFAHNKVPLKELKKIQPTQNGEALTPVQRKAIYLNDVQKIAVPGRLTPNEVRLYDDGSHNDKFAGDGIYTNTITDTSREGTYVFHVYASGPTEGNSGFDRDAFFHKYLVPRVSADTAITGVQLNSDYPNIKRYELTIVPQDAFGNYLGPKYARSLTMKTKPEVSFEKLSDNLDGTYSQVLRLPENININEVEISLTAQDTKLLFTLGDKIEKTNNPNLIPWVVALVLIVLVFVLVLMRRRVFGI